ncbi:MAG: type II secretion system F family protein [PVC group bacterium]|nr:type II secretion system F family protein [PVC group bacterium]
MGTFKYRAKKGPNDIIDSTIEADSKEEAIEKISQLGYLAMHIEKTDAADAMPLSKGGLFRLGVSKKRITVFTRQLSILLKSGVPILKALGVLAEQSENNYLKAVVNEIYGEIKKGRTLSAALEGYLKIFSPLYIALVRTGENSGTLDEALFRISEYRYRQEQIISNVRTALTYPLLMAVVGVGTVVFMLMFVMPKLLKIFTRLGQDLPLPTKILIAISHFLRQGWVWVGFVLLCVAIGLIIKYGMRSKKQKLMLSALKLRLPIFGEIFLKTELARFSRTLELLLKSGIQLLNAIRVSIPTLSNEMIREALRQGYSDIERGESVGRTLKRFPVFPKFMANLVSVGEESGRLEEVLEELTNTYERETDESVKIMTNLLEPIMILIMGIIIGGIIIAMLLPVFQINVVMN